MQYMNITAKFCQESLTFQPKGVPNKNIQETTIIYVIQQNVHIIMQQLTAWKRLLV